MEKLSFVIPCYNSENTLEAVVNDIIENVEKLKDYDYEIILVNDFSPDNVLGVIENLCKKTAKIKGIELSRNFGQHNAIMAGYRVSTGDVIFTIDDDGQFSSENILDFLHKMDDGYDIVIGKFTNTAVGAFKKLGSKVNSLMARFLINKPKDLEITSLYAMRRYVIDEIIRYENPYAYLAGLMLRSTGKIANVPIKQYPRIAGESSYSFKKLFSLWMNGFTAFSVKPLRFATLVGAITAIAGFIFALYVIIRKIVNPSISAGYSSTIAIMLFIGGLIMLMLGMIGEYVGRIYITINKSPQYVIRNTINIKEGDSEKDK